MNVDNTHIYYTDHSPIQLVGAIHHKLLCRDKEVWKMWAERRNILAHGYVIVCKWSIKIAFLQNITTSADSYI